MSTLKNSNVSFDGMRDVFDTMNSNGSTSAWSLNNQKHIDRSPFLNGGIGDGKVPLTFNDAEASLTTSMSAADFKSVMKVDGGSATATTGVNKSQTLHTVAGWGTLHGMYAASHQNITNSNSGIGQTYDGTNTYEGVGNPSGLSNQNFIPFTNFSSSFNSNKDLAALAMYTSGFTVRQVTIVFRGSGASATDTDWNNVYIRQVNDSYLSGDEASNKQYVVKLSRGLNMTTTTYTNILYGDYYVHHWNVPALSSFTGVATSWVKFD